MFPALDPLKIRQTKAREVFLLFKRTENLNKKLEKYQKTAKKKEEEAMDVTGRYDCGWF